MWTRAVQRREYEIAAGYFGMAVFSIVATRFDSGFALLWLPASLLIAILKRRPLEEWTGVIVTCAVASVAATALFGAGPALALPLALANMAEAMVAAAIMRALHAPERPLGSTGWTATLIAAVGIAGPLAMVAIAALPMWLALGHGLEFTFERVMLGHGLCNIIGVPIFALYGAGLRDARQNPGQPHRRAQIAILFLIQLVVNIAVFGQADMPLLFLALLPSVVIAFRCGSRAAASSLILLALISGFATIMGRGPIYLFEAPLAMHLQLLCFYLVTIVLTIMPIAAGIRSKSHLLIQVSDSEQRYKMLADHSGDIIMHCDAQGVVTFISPSIERVGGYKPEELEGTNCLAITHPDSRETVEAHYHFALSNQSDTRFEYRARRKDGRWGWFESECRGVTDLTGALGVVSVIRDISDRKAREDQLATAAMTDFLTGLPNRRAFRAAAMRVLEDQPGQTASIAVFDIDHFKSVNDRFGHDAGDEVLQSFAAIAQRVRRKDDVMARLGGEEFAVLLPDTSVEAAIKVCERLREEIAKSVCITSRGPVRITLSGGVAVLSGDGLDASVRRADEALYLAKQQGRDRLLLAAAA